MHPTAAIDDDSWEIRTYALVHGDGFRDNQWKGVHPRAVAKLVHEERLDNRGALVGSTVIPVDHRQHGVNAGAGRHLPCLNHAHGTIAESTVR
jgi:hypothetical protein